MYTTSLVPSVSIEDATESHVVPEYRKQVGEKTPYRTSASIQVPEIATGPGTYEVCVVVSLQHFPQEDSKAYGGSIKSMFEAGRLTNLNVYAEDANITFTDVAEPCNVTEVFDNRHEALKGWKFEDTVRQAANIKNRMLERLAVRFEHFSR